MASMAVAGYAARSAMDRYGLPQSHARVMSCLFGYGRGNDRAAEDHG